MPASQPSFHAPSPMRRLQRWLLPVGLAAVLLMAYVYAEADAPPDAVGGDAAVVQTTNPPLTAKDVYQLGEQITYNVTWNGQAVGQAISVVDRVMEKDGHKVFLIKSYTRANDFISVVYPVNDRVESYVDTTTLAPVYFNKVLREGDFKRDEYLTIDWKDQIATFFRKKGEEYQQKGRVYVPQLVQDPLSVMFYMRGLELAVGKTYSITVVDSRRTSALQVQVDKEETIDIRNVGSFECYKLIPSAEYEGIFKRKKADGVMWIDKQTRIPVRVDVEIPLGNIVIALESVTNIYQEAEARKAPADRWWKNKPAADQPKSDDKK